jgi:hypothetical protein
MDQRATLISKMTTISLRVLIAPLRGRSQKSNLSKLRKYLRLTSSSITLVTMRLQ